jgi:hypothetical protein
MEFADLDVGDDQIVGRECLLLCLCGVELRALLSCVEVEVLFDAVPFLWIESWVEGALVGREKVMVTSVMTVWGLSQLVVERLDDIAVFGGDELARYLGALKA